jgi:AcrR family transcriptional regulator
MGNMAEETPRNLISATETLLVEKGHAGVTLRDITDLAGANVAAFAYHFGSKDDLVAKVYADALAEVTSVQRQALEALPTNATLRDVVVTWLSPALDPESTTARQRNLWALIHRGALEQAPGFAVAATTLIDNDNPLMSRLAALLPDVPVVVLQLRHDLVLGGVSAIFGRGLQSSPGTSDVMPLNPDVIVDWVIGGLSATHGLRPDSIR